VAITEDALSLMHNHKQPLDRNQGLFGCCGALDESQPSERMEATGLADHRSTAGHERNPSGDVYACKII
jgi:hypothetical protein